MSKKIAQIILSIIISGALIFVLSREASFNELGAVLQLVNSKSFLAGLLIFTMANVLRTIRMSYILFSKPLDLRIFAILMFNNMIAFIVPFRLGEFSFIYLSKKKLKLKVSNALSTLFVVRFFDFHITTLLLCAALVLIFFSNQAYISASVVLLLFLVMAIGLFVFSLPGTWNLIYRLLIKLVQRSSPGGKFYASVVRIESLVIAIRENVSDALASKKKYFLFSVSLLIHLLGTVMYYIMMQSMGIDIGFQFVFISIALANIAAIFPLAIAGYGTIESGMLTGFLMSGLSYDGSFSLSLILHTLLLMYLIISGLIGWIIYVSLSDAAEAG